jgi:tryptophan synthase alpha chain
VTRIAGCFEQLVEEGRKAVIPYIVVGDPSLDITVDLMHEFVTSGADIIELGVPFSDPMSEGPVIQLAHERALANGASLRDALDTVRTFREKNQTTPVLLMGYANPVEHMGYAKFSDAAAEAGLDALLTVDIPPEEVAPVNAELQRAGMDNIFLVAPTTPDERLHRIVDQASGFVYYVSLKGVTGAGHLDIDNVAHHVSRIRDNTQLPVAVGFGIKDAESAAAVAGVADGVVVGSALIRAMAEAIDGGADHVAAGKVAAGLLAEIRRGVDSVTS